MKEYLIDGVFFTDKQLMTHTPKISHIWSFLQRTKSDIGHSFQRLETVLREKLILTLVGKHVSDTERRILVLPVRLGGIGITDPYKLF